jgi:hypothetical protein
MAIKVVGNESPDIIRNLGDFAPTYRWNLEFSSVPSALNTFRLKDLSVRCTATDAPSKQPGETIAINLRGFRTREHGLRDGSGTMVITFVETVNMVVSKFMSAWSGICWNKGKATQLTKSEVSAKILLTRFDRQLKPIVAYDIWGCFLEDSSSGGDLGSEESEVFRPTLTISYDYYNKTYL